MANWFICTFINQINDAKGHLQCQSKINIYIDFVIIIIRIIRLMGRKNKKTKNERKKQQRKNDWQRVNQLLLLLYR